MYKHWVERITRFLFIGGIAASFFLIIKYTFFILFPILAAIILTIMIHPAVTFFEKKLYFPRSLATAFIILVSFALIFGVTILLIAELIQGTTYLADKIPAHFQTFTAYFETFLHETVFPYYRQLTSLFHTLNPSQQSAVTDNIEQFISQFSASGTVILKTILLKISAVLSKLPQSLTVFMFIILATFLLTNDWVAVKQWMMNVVPSRLNAPGKNIFVHLKKAFSGFFKAQFILISITAGIIYMGLLFIGVDHAMTIALLAAAVDLLPYIGTGIIFIPWIIYLFITGDYPLTISLALIYMFITIIRQVLEPKILSVNIGLHPLAALIALFIGIQLWGVLGLIAAPLLLIVLNVFYQTGVLKQLWLFIKG